MSPVTPFISVVVSTQGQLELRIPAVVPHLDRGWKSPGKERNASINIHQYRMYTTDALRESSLRGITSSECTFTLPKSGGEGGPVSPVGLISPRLLHPQNPSTSTNPPLNDRNGHNSRQTQAASRSQRFHSSRNHLLSFSRAPPSSFPQTLRSEIQTFTPPSNRQTTRCNQ